MGSSSALADIDKKFYTRRQRPLKSELFYFLTVLNSNILEKKSLGIPEILSSNGLQKNVMDFGKSKVSFLELSTAF